MSEPEFVPGTRADLSVRTASETRYVDVSICSPSANVYLVQGSATTPGVAANVRGQQKDAHYNLAKQQARLAGLPVRPGLFVWPLVWEATGRPSEGVIQFLQSIFVGRYANRKKIILTFAQTLAVKYCAKAVKAWETLLTTEMGYGGMQAAAPI